MTRLLLLYWVQMMSDTVLAEEVGGRFDHVLVDEYQDTNLLQSSILLGLKPRGKGLTVVGDDSMLQPRTTEFGRSFLAFISAPDEESPAG